MRKLTSFSNRLAALLYKVAGAAVMAMMTITCVDVALRLCVTVFRKYQWGVLSNFEPIAGAYELVGFLGSVSVSFAMAYTFIQKGHVSVSLITRLLSRRLQSLVHVATNLLSLTFFALISYRSILYAAHTRISGEVSSTLQLPFYPFIYGVGLASAAVCLAIFLELIEHLKILRVK